jgi:Ca-activated chloride channel family protein
VALLVAALPVLLSARQFSSGVSIVEVYASVTDDTGEPITGLGKEDFQVSEDGVPQVVSVFAAGDFPLTVALAVDRSFSMAGERLAVAKSAARVFLGALRPEDESAIIAIGSRIETIAPLSTDRAAQNEALLNLDAFGTTGLYDAVSRAIELTQQGKGRRALVILSDGTDRYSSATADDAVAEARKSDVMVYPVALGPRPSPFFERIAAVTGGRAFHLKDIRQLSTTLARIARELRFQYLLGYVPSHEGPGGAGGWRSIRVDVKRPGMTVRAREGYQAR